MSLYMELTPEPRTRKSTLLDTYFKKLNTLKTSDAFLLKTILIVCSAFILLFLIQLSLGYTIKIASTGGVFTEGIVGTPRFINPVLAVTRADKDLTTLIYDGIMGLSKDGVLEPRLAESVTISEDGLIYNVILRKGTKFHDGAELTAHDVGFTVSRIQDPLLSSPLRANFDGVTIEEVGDYEINFILPEPYAPFIENLTFGILPQHTWKDAGSEEFPFSQHNSEPIGSGPYTIQEIIRSTSGIPETYILTANQNYFKDIPKIETIKLHFFPTDEKLIQAFSKGTIDSVVGVDAALISKLNLDPETHHVERIPLPRTFAIFINQNKSPALRDLSARQALNLAVDRTALVQVALGGYGNPLATPIPVGFGTPHEIPAPDFEKARDILKSGGWKLNAENQVWEKDIDGTITPLAFSIATVNNGMFEATAEFLRSSWEKLGAQVTIKQFEQSDLTQAVIRPRDYEALLFGTQLGRSLDYYSFWHSSQRNDPGLNIASYANITTDSILTEMRRNTNLEGRDSAIEKFATEIDTEVPAIFLFAPELLYVFPNTVANAMFTRVSEPFERFARVQDWYIETESVWPFFTKENN